jgi:alpha-mannosidase
VPEEFFSADIEWDGLVPGYVKRDPVAWFCSHRHHPAAGDEHYQYSYLFKYGFDLPGGAVSIRLPDNPNIRVFAITVAKNANDAARAARPLYDTLEDRSNPALASRPAIAPAGGRFDDATLVAINPPLYFRSGGLRYTLDGSEPTAQSPLYSQPFLIHQKVTVRARQFEGDLAGPEASATIDVNDITSPAVRSASAVSIVPSVTVEFSEPVDPATAQSPNAFRFDPPAEVKSVALSDDGRTVALTLARPLPPEAENRLVVSGVADISPGGNRVEQRAIAVAVASPVFQIDSVICAGEPTEQRVAGLPVKAGDPWTINFFVRTDAQPENRTLIAGFGRTEDLAAGAARYLSKFASGIHFWSHNRDVQTRTPLQVGQWQMLSATYDGQTLRVYKDAQQIGASALELADDEPIVQFAPVRPWRSRSATAPANQYRFKGEIRKFSIWNAALPPEALAVLRDAGHEATSINIPRPR